jgi:hypothetical protein
VVSSGLGWDEHEPRTDQLTFPAPDTAQVLALATRLTTDEGYRVGHG